METTETRTLRKKDSGKTRFEYIRSQDIRRRYNPQEIGKWITWRREECNEHITRMAPERIVRAVRDNSPTGRHSLGRPRERWSDTF
jgi:hypothetical protein